jgi:hypothetical protein
MAILLFTLIHRWELTRDVVLQHALPEHLQHLRRSHQEFVTSRKLLGLLHAAFMELHFVGYHLSC